MIRVMDHYFRAIREEIEKRTAEYLPALRNALLGIRHSSLLSASIIGPLLLLIFFCGEALGVPSFEEVRTSHRKSDSILLDRHGEVIHELRTNPGGRRLDWTALQDISPSLQEAVIQAEDRRFYHHGGVDYLAMTGALLRGMTSPSFRGASTITMQLASMLDRKLLPVKGKRSLFQKWRQIRAAFEIEDTWSKKEILEAYLNLVT